MVGCADHAAIGDDADPADGKATPEPIDDRQESADIGRVAGPHLGAHRPAVGIDHDAQDHLHQLGTVVLGMATPAERRPTGADERQRRRVHEDDAELAEQIAPVLDQMLLDQVLHAARRERRGAGLLRLGQLLAEPSHGAVEVVQGEVRRCPGWRSRPSTSRRPGRSRRPSGGAGWR